MLGWVGGWVGGCAAKGRARASSSIIPLNFDMFGDHAGAVSQRFHTSLPLFTGTQPLLPLTQTFFPYVYTNIPPARPACNPPGAIMGHPWSSGAHRGISGPGRLRAPGMPGGLSPRAEQGPPPFCHRVGRFTYLSNQLKTQNLTVAILAQAQASNLITFFTASIVDSHASTLIRFQLPSLIRFQR